MNVDEAFEILKQYKITTHKESIRRWLRNGQLKGIPPVSRKEGWRISEEDLHYFIQSRLPSEVITPFNATNVVSKEDRESIRSEMWWELVKRNVFEGFLDIRKRQIKDCIEHNRQPKEFAEHVWAELTKKSWYKSPRIPYLLDAFFFDGQRIKMDKAYESLDEQILFPLIESIRNKRVNKQP